jgi:phosphonate transport system substrate-binding protein
MKLISLRLCFAVVLCLSLNPIVADAANPAECESPPALRFSLVPQGNVQKDLAELQPLLEELRSRLGIAVETYVPSSYGAVVEGLLSGAVHLAHLGPASYVAAKRADQNLTPFASYALKANAYQEAGAFYYSLLIVRSDSKYASPASLRDKRVMLVDPNSTSGFLVPRHVFAKEVGAPLEQYFGQLGYTGSHLASIDQVLRGQADAAFVGSGNLASALADPVARQKIRVVWRSGPIPLDLFAYRGQLCDSLKAKIRGVFLGSGNPQKSAVLDKLGASGFVPVSDQDYQVVREIH